MPAVEAESVIELATAEAPPAVVALDVSPEPSNAVPAVPTVAVTGCKVALALAATAATTLAAVAALLAVTVSVLVLES